MASQSPPNQSPSKVKPEPSSESFHGMNPDLPVESFPSLSIRGHGFRQRNRLPGPRPRRSSADSPLIEPPHSDLALDEVTVAMLRKSWARVIAERSSTEVKEEVKIESQQEHLNVSGLGQPKREDEFEALTEENLFEVEVKYDFGEFSDLFGSSTASRNDK